MKKIIISIIFNKNGSAIIIAVLVLAAVTILGISASNTSNVEIMLTNNDILYKDNFYKAEAAAMEGAQTLQNATPEELIFSGENKPNWLNESIDMTDLSLWDADGVGDTDTAAYGSLDSTRYSVVFVGIDPESSIDLTNPTLLRKFCVFGHSSRGASSNFIEIGYKRRY